MKIWWMLKMQLRIIRGMQKIRMKMVQTSRTRRLNLQIKRIWTISRPQQMEKLLRIHTLLVSKGRQMKWMRLLKKKKGIMRRRLNQDQPKLMMQ